MDELTKLRVSVARIAQEAGVSLDCIGLADGAGYGALVVAAQDHDRNWNALAARIVDCVAGMRRRA